MTRGQGRSGGVLFHRSAAAFHNETLNSGTRIDIALLADIHITTINHFYSQNKKKNLPTNKS